MHDIGRRFVISSFVMSHCMPMLSEAMSSSSPPDSWRSRVVSSSCLASAVAVKASVGKLSVRLIASAAEFFLPAKWTTLNLNWLSCTLARPVCLVLIQFLPRDSYAKRGICRRRVSVCVSVTLRYCIKTAKRRITQTTPHDSAMTLVF